MLGWNVSMQYTPPLVEPIGERRSAWWVISQIMKRAKLPVPEHVPDDDRAPEADEFMLSQLFGNARCGFEEVRAKRYVEMPLEFPAPWLDAHIERIGGWKLAHPKLLEQWHQMRRADESALGQPKPLCYSSRRQRRKFNAQLSFLGAPADIILHPSDAALHGIADGQKVRVHNPNGEIVLTAKLNAGMRRGVFSISHGHEIANVNFLTSVADMDPLGGMALYTGVPISVEPLA
jgi:anaerobic selenocysteine-containing dehydrogenase